MPKIKASASCKHKCIYSVDSGEEAEGGEQLEGGDGVCGGGGGAGEGAAQEPARPAGILCR